MLRVLRFVADALAGALLILAAVGARYGEPPWSQDPDTLRLAASAALAYVAGLAVVRLAVPATGPLLRRLAGAAGIAAAVALPVPLLVVLTDADVQKLTLLTEVGLVVLLLLLEVLVRRPGLRTLVLLGGLALVAGPSLQDSARASLMERLRADRRTDRPAPQYVFSSLHDLEVTAHEVLPKVPPGAADPGGAIELLDDRRLLLVDANGRFRLVSLDAGLTVTELPGLNAPMNRAEYVREAVDPSRFFRVTDLLVVDEGVAGQRTLFVAHHRWDREGRCVTLDLAEGQLQLARPADGVAWRPLFRSTPCIPMAEGLTNETGGRIARLPSGDLLLTVGVSVVRFERTAYPDASYGKVIRIARASGAASVFTTGHRNPQGLLVDGDVVWETEHGPDGGDELNLLAAGGDYGWPAASYGVDYGQKTFRDSPRPGEHDAGIRPVYAWVPSVGISRLIRVRGTAFTGWRDDLLVGALSGRGNGYGMYRVRLHDGSPRVVERIPTGLRVRDLIELPDGRLASWDGSRILQVMAPATHVFSACSGCHAVNKGWPSNGIGPDLWGVVGRDVAANAEFAYSGALRGIGGRWSRDRLDWFLRDPQGAVPGTLMKVPGITDAEQRRQIIDYLERAGRR